MSIGVELTRADLFVWDRLANDATLFAALGSPGGSEKGVFGERAPQGSTLPYVVFSVAAEGPDRRSLGGGRIAVRPLYLVRAYAQTRSWQGILKTLADRIDARLHLPAFVGAVAGDGRVGGCLRESAFRQVEEEAGQEFRALGGFYRLWVEGPA